MHVRVRVHASTGGASSSFLHSAHEHRHKTRPQGHATRTVTRAGWTQQEYAHTRGCPVQPVSSPLQVGGRTDPQPSALEAPPTTAASPNPAPVVSTGHAANQYPQQEGGAGWGLWLLGGKTGPCPQPWFSTWGMGLDGVGQAGSPWAQEEGSLWLCCPGPAVLVQAKRLPWRWGHLHWLWCGSSFQLTWGQQARASCPPWGHTLSGQLEPHPCLHAALKVFLVPEQV